MSDTAKMLLPPKEEFEKSLENVLAASERPIDLIILSSISLFSFILHATSDISDIKKLASKNKEVAEELIIASPFIAACRHALQSQIEKIDPEAVKSALEGDKTTQEKASIMARGFAKGILQAFYGSIPTLDMADKMTLRGSTAYLRIAIDILMDAAASGEDKASVVLAKFGPNGISALFTLLSALEIGKDYDLKKMPMATFKPLLVESFASESHMFYSGLLSAMKEDEATKVEEKKV